MDRVDRFQNDPTITVFLISLKAGGVGLNLTGADTVIHFDPWWNPAVEDQATDRAHRIGQSKVVTVYKLVARGTIEEQILALGEKKRNLVEAVLGDEAAAANRLTKQDVEDLFGMRPLPAPTAP
jgi:SNF2 family DNA or RNA helicase